MRVKSQVVGVRVESQVRSDHVTRVRASAYTPYLSVCLFVCLLLMRCRFDLLANGGASLTLSFERAPFLTQYRTVWVPWNVFYVMDTLVMKKVSGHSAARLDVCLSSRDPTDILT